MTKIKTLSGKLQQQTKFMLEMPKNKKAAAIIADRFKRSLLGEESIPEDYMPVRKITGRQKYLARIYREYLEAAQSLEGIDLSAKLISRTVKGTSQVDYLRYHYEHYLNEIYIFSTRINTLLDYLISRCQKAQLKNEAKRIKVIQDAFNSGMEGIVKRRGGHVHRRRYQDRKLEQLIGLEALGKDIDLMRELKEMELKKVRGEMISEMKRNRKALGSLLEEDLYKHLGAIIFKSLYLAQTKHRS